MIDIEYYLNKLSNDKFAIFLFHGVIDKTDSKVRNYTKKHLLQEEFKELIKQLKNTGHPLSMEDICNLNQTKQPPPPNSYAITFDDGFENNFTLAAPILEHFSTPGCFYVSTGLIENNEMTWIDKIEYCLEVIDNANIKLPWDEEYTYVFNSKTKITFFIFMVMKIY